MTASQTTDLRATAFETVDSYLAASYGLGLEDVLLDGCMVGQQEIRLAEAAKVLPRLLRVEREDDGGEYHTYEGVLILGGVWYRFGCHIFVDAGGGCFVADISDFEAVEWKVRLAV
jgi:hypothetical protein